MKKVVFHTIGCRLNQAETAVLVDRLKRVGYEAVEFGQPTDVLVLNTCSVTGEAEADCRYAIRRTLRRSPHAFVAVTGCYAQTGVQALRGIPGVDLILGNQYKMKLPDYLPSLSFQGKRSEPVLLHSRTIDREDFVQEGVGDYGTTRANLKIQDGCNFMCSFCLIPFARGRERSRCLDDVLREGYELVERGHRELVLTGVNIGRFANGGVGITELVQRLEEIPGLDRIRISSIEPTTIPEELLDLMGSSKKLCRFLHVPLQSGDDGILQAMNRRYTVREYTDWVERMVTRIPDLCVGTDLMVGFPGEGPQQFDNTFSVARDLPFAYFHIFSYSPRPGTAATRLGQRISPPIIKARNRRLAELSRTKRLGFYQRFVDRSVSVLFETKGPEDLWTGLTDNFIRVGVTALRDLTNQICQANITGVMDGLAIGQLTAQPSHPAGKRTLPMLKRPLV